MGFVTQPSPVADTLKSRYTGEVGKETLDSLMELESPVSPNNEQKLWGFLETRAALLLKSYPTSIQVCPWECCHPSFICYITLCLSQLKLLVPKIALSFKVSIYTVSLIGCAC